MVYFLAVRQFWCRRMRYTFSKFYIPQELVETVTYISTYTTCEMERLRMEGERPVLKFLEFWNAIVQDLDSN